MKKLKTKTEITISKKKRCYVANSNGRTCGSMPFPRAKTEFFEKIQKMKTEEFFFVDCPRVRRDEMTFFYSSGNKLFGYPTLGSVIRRLDVEPCVALFRQFCQLQMSISHSGDHILQYDDLGILELRDGENGKKLKDLFPSLFLAGCFHPFEKFIVCIEGNEKFNHITTFDYKSTESHAEHKKEIPLLNCVKNMEFSPDGKSLWIASKDLLTKFSYPECMVLREWKVPELNFIECISEIGSVCVSVGKLKKQKHLIFKKWISRQKVMTLLLLSRKSEVNCPFYFELFPLDLLKIVFDLAFYD